jgi:hypothetical protein
MSGPLAVLMASYLNYAALTFALVHSRLKLLDTREQLAADCRPGSSS